MCVRGKGDGGVEVWGGGSEGEEGEEGRAEPPRREVENLGQASQLDVGRHKHSARGA